MGTPLPLPWHEIDAWCRVMQVTLKTWELDAILRLDHVWLAVMAETGHPFDDVS